MMSWKLAYNAKRKPLTETLTALKNPRLFEGARVCVRVWISICAGVYAKIFV